MSSDIQPILSKILSGNQSQKKKKSILPGPSGTGGFLSGLANPEIGVKKDEDVLPPEASRSPKWQQWRNSRIYKPTV